MNLFYIFRCPKKSAQFLCDKHVVKMIVETAQLLSTAHHAHATASTDKEFLKKIYRKTHLNHPSAVWVRQSAKHYRWAYRHFCALMDEYTARYQKRHASERLRDVLSEVPAAISSVKTWTPPPKAMPDHIKDIPRLNTVAAYRKYYQEKAKNDWFKYARGREPPAFLELSEAKRKQVTQLSSDANKRKKKKTNEEQSSDSTETDTTTTTATSTDTTETSTTTRTTRLRRSKRLQADTEATSTARHPE
ncbi:MAG: hypothetical protein MHM6MM_006557 [Cercozoa sp. M6MM]